MTRRALGLALVAAGASLVVGARRAGAHDGVDMHATRIHVSGSGPVAIETGLGLVVRSPSDASAWTLLCTDSASVGRPLGAALAGTSVVLASEAGLRTYALDSCARARTSVPFDGIGTAFAATAEGDAQHALVSDDGKWSSALVSFEGGVERRRALPTAIREGRLFALGAVACATGRDADDRARLECVDDGGGWSDRALPLPIGARVEPVAVVAHGAALRAVLAVRTPFDEPDALVMTSDRGATFDASARALERIEKVKGAAAHGGRLLVVGRAVAGADAANGTLYALDPTAGTLEVLARNGPPYDCLAADARGLYACVDRAIDARSATVLASSTEGASWEPVFTFAEIARLEGCGGARCLSQRGALCVGAGTFCEGTSVAAPAADAGPEEAAPRDRGCAVATGGGSALPAAIVLIAAALSLRARGRAGSARRS